VNDPKNQAVPPATEATKRRSYAPPRVESEPVTERHALYSCGGGNNDAPFEGECCAAVPG
jgi:hypothetical protein